MYFPMFVFGNVDVLLGSSPAPQKCGLAPHPTPYTTGAAAPAAARRAAAPGPWGIGKVGCKSTLTRVKGNPDSESDIGV